MGCGAPTGLPGKRMQRSACIPASATISSHRSIPVVGTVDIPEVGRVETIQLSSPPRSGQLSPESPRTIAFEDLVPLSPNRVQAG